MIISDHRTEGHYTLVLVRPSRPGISRQNVTKGQ
jgi:hypothetical protein